MELIESFPEGAPDFDTVWQEAMEQYLDEQYVERMHIGEAASCSKAREQDGKAK
jgi:hypothetical protein